MQDSRGPHKKYASQANGEKQKLHGVCSYCARHPRPNERYQTCGRCKVLTYCSRECQKKDWPEHKLCCKETEMQCKYMLKFLKHANDDNDILPLVRFTLVAEFHHKWSTNPEPRKMWVICAVAGICPFNSNHLKELEDPDIPLSSLSGKQMMGLFMFVDLVDMSNTTVHPLDDRSRAIWQTHRDVMDKQGHPDAHVVLAKFTYWNQTLMMVPFAVGRSDLVDFKVGDLENPKMLRRLNAAISRGALGGTNPKKWSCLLGDNDKKQTRDRARLRKVWEAEHGVKAESCI